MDESPGMSLVENRIETINDYLIQGTQSIKNIGLINGKMGLSIYFFYLSRQTGKREHLEFAERLIDEVYEEVGENRTSPDFENGLAGIAWGIEHLVQGGFVEADTNMILSEVDDQIYRYVVSSEDVPAGLLKGALGYMLYVFSRLHNIDDRDESSVSFIFKRLLIQLINYLGEMVEGRRFQFREPSFFDLSWDLPLTLVVLAKARSLNVHNSKIDRILAYLSPIIVSLYPGSVCNRLYLLLGIESVLQQTSIPKWKGHTSLLRTDIDPGYMLHQDLKNKNICLVDGATGIWYITRRLYEITGDELFLFRNGDLIQKIMTSEYWKVIEREEPKKRNPGLFFGLAGIGIGLLDMAKQGHEAKEISI